MQSEPGSTFGLRHVALKVRDFERCLDFYTRILSMQVEWKPDDDTVFLTSGTDNLALHRSSESAAAAGQRLDHIGFIVGTPNEVDAWHERLMAADVPVPEPPKTHRDGARSFFCEDPDGTLIQIIFHPPLARK